MFSTHLRLCGLSCLYDDGILMMLSCSAFFPVNYFYLSSGCYLETSLRMRASGNICFWKCHAVPFSNRSNRSIMSTVYVPSCFRGAAVELQLRAGFKKILYLFIILAHLHFIQ